MNRYRLSIAIAGHLDIPTGDPFGGPAYGKREMPFIVGPAIGTIATAVTAGVAAAGGAMAVVGAVSSIAMVAGLAMTVVGAITGDKDLMEIGGYVGLAGGVGGLATSLVGTGTAAASAAATAATPAANAGATTAAQGGMTGATEAATAAITPAFASAAPQTALTAAPSAVSGTAQGAISGGSGILGRAGGAALEAAAPTTVSSGLGSSVGAGIGADVGANVGQSVNAASSYVPSQTGSFFDYIGSPQGLMEVGKVGAGMIQGMAKQDQLDTQNKILQDKLDYERDTTERQYRNSNVQGRLNLRTRPVTQAERDQAKLDQAARARRTAELLTKPAGA
jgi:hypothetical protein